MYHRQGLENNPDDNQKSCFAEFLSGYDRSIVLISADSNYLELSNISLLSDRCEIGYLFENERCEMIRRWMDSYQGHRYEMNYIRSGKHGRLWRMKAVIEFPHLYITGKEFIIPEMNLYSFAADRSPEHTGIIIAKRDSGNYLCNMKGGRLPDIFAGIKAGDMLAEYIKDGNEYKKLSGAMDKLIDGVLYGQELIMNLRCSQQLLVKLTKMDSPEKDCVMLYILRNGSESGSEGESLGERFLAGFASLRKSGQSYYFYDINSYMSHLLHNDRISRTDITGSFPFRSAVSELTSSCGRAEHYTANGSKWRYMLSATPLLESGHLDRVIICLVPSDNNAMLDSDRLSILSPRESNVVRLTAEGFDSKYISRVLGISEGTVKRELSSSYQKLNVRTKTEAVMKLFHLL